jgi:hypothetical protein
VTSRTYSIISLRNVCDTEDIFYHILTECLWHRGHILSYPYGMSVTPRTYSVCGSHNLVLSSFMVIIGFVFTWGICESLVEQGLLIFPEFNPSFSGVSVAQSLVSVYCFVNQFVLLVSIFWAIVIVCPVIYSFWLPPFDMWVVSSNIMKDPPLWHHQKFILNQSPCYKYTNWVYLILNQSPCYKYTYWVQTSL